MYRLDEPATLLCAGLIPGIKNDDYHASVGVSKSQLDRLAKSPAHYMASLTTPRKETAAMRMGTLAHTLILEPERARLAVAPNCDKRTKAGKAEWEAFCAENEDAEVVTADELETLQGMRDAVMGHAAAGKLLSAGIAEASAYWKDPATQELCRCRPDFFRPDRIVVDLKTTEDASPEAFARAIWNYRYHVQCAFYSDGIEHSTGEPVRGFVFVVVEKSAPYAVAVYQLDAQAVAIGREQYQENLFTLAECRRSGKWGSYSDRIETISLPGWATRGYDYE